MYCSCDLPIFIMVHVNSVSDIVSDICFLLTESYCNKVIPILYYFVILLNDI